ncbi:MAG: hypothetical protein E7578_02100 [Ruminococcaceae bacterium]|nr:hypothetical protein [Oscillospiraceae bacterium]
MKKALSFFLSLVLLFSVITANEAIAEDYLMIDEHCPMCGHIMSAGYIEPTCVTDGYIVWECSNCGASFTEELPDFPDASLHRWDLRETLEPNCYEEGYEFYVCYICGEEKYEYFAIPPHYFVEYKGKEPTCTENGWYPYEECIRCGYSTYEPIPAPGHDFVFYPYSTPKCFTGGVQTGEYVCDICGYTEGVDAPMVIRHVDLRPVYTVEPTCVDDGYTEYECYECFRGYETETIPATGIHTPGDWATVSEPTVTTEGLRTKSCTVCNTVLESEVIPMIAVDNGSVTVTSEYDTVMVGQTFDVYVSVSDCEPVKSIAFVPIYDVDVFELVSAEWLTSATIQITEPEIVSAWMNPTDINGNVLKLVLRAKDVADSSMISAKTYYHNTEHITLDSVPDSVNVIECIHEHYSIVPGDESFHVNICDLCGYSFESVHTYDFDCDAKCNDCGHTREVTHIPCDSYEFSETEHWINCVVCGETIECHSHEYDGDDDPSCDVCGYIRLLRGDMDEDGDVDSDDSILLLLYVYAPGSYELSQNGDMDGDGDVDSDDSIRILLYIYFPTEYPLSSF